MRTWAQTIFAMLSKWKPKDVLNFQNCVLRLKMLLVEKEDKKKQNKNNCCLYISLLFILGFFFHTDKPFNQILISRVFQFLKHFYLSQLLCQFTACSNTHNYMYNYIKKYFENILPVIFLWQWSKKDNLCKTKLTRIVTMSFVSRTYVV